MIVIGITVVSREVKAEEATSLPVNIAISNGSDAGVIRDGGGSECFWQDFSSISEGERLLFPA